MTRRLGTWAAAALILSTLMMLLVIQRVRRGDIAEILEKVDGAQEATVMVSGSDFIQITDTDGARIVVGRNPDETSEEFILRVERIRAGEEGGTTLCWVSSCPGVGTVRICVACMEGETTEDCQDRLDELVAAWCNIHPSCSGCP